jgi:predicted metalloprotease with PDZ domain
LKFSQIFIDLHMLSQLSCAIACVALTLPIFNSAALTEPIHPPVEMTLKVMHDGRAYQGFSISLSFYGHASGETSLYLPDQWGGERDLYRFVHDLTAEGGTIAPGNGPGQRVLRHAPNAKVSIRYRVAAAKDEPARDKPGNDYRPQFAATHFHVLGNTMMVKPASVHDSAPARIRIDGVPQGTTFASDLQHQEMGRKLVAGDLMESVLVGGDFRLIDAGGGARLAIRGEWQRTDVEWSAAFQRIAQSQRAYWQSGDEPFLVTILPLPTREQGWTSVGGTGRSDAFAFFATTNASPARIDQVMAHEMMHTWVPRRIARMPDKDEQLSYWLSEGFTDWATWRVMVRSGAWTPADFAKAFNEAVQEYDRSPVKSAPNTLVLEKFWRDGDVQKLPYKRGMFFAVHLDRLVRGTTKGTKNLDDVLAIMQRETEKNPNERDTARRHLMTAVKEVAGLDIARDLEAHIDRGEPVVLPEDVYTPCGAFSARNRPIFHRGFDVEATTKGGNIIQGTIVDGPAHQAGLRDGMKLVKRSGGEIGNAEVEIRYDVIDGETPKTLAWMPVGKGTELLREFKVDSALNGETLKACTARLGG